MTFPILLLFGFLCSFAWSLLLEARDTCEDVDDNAVILLLTIFVTILSLLTMLII